MKQIIENFFDDKECQRIIKLGYELGYEKPTIKTSTGNVIKESVRNNGRAIYQNKKFADELFDKIKKSLPQEISGYQLKGLNEEMKIYRYEKGQRFKMHTDVPFVRGKNEKSLLTIMVYLNEDFEGGATWFMDGSVEPKTGNALIFTQSLLHAGAEVKEGVKYAIRTDIMYEKS